MNATSFAELGLSPEILRAVTEAGYTTPTPIQAQAIPVVLAGLDIMGGAQTGTGKTAGFGLPILQRLQPYANTSPSPARHHVRALILAPTRELAIQVEEAIKEYGKYTGLRSTCVFGGVDIKQQLPIVRAGVEILVATPGRLLDHIEHKSVHLGQVEIFVLDEADRMLDMGFIPDIKRIMALLPATAKRQNLLFSATFSNEIKRLADQLLNEPQLIEVDRRNQGADSVTQRAYRCPQDAKRALLTHIVKSRNVWQVLCFVRTKHGASRLARQLEKDGLVTEAIHGDKTQQARLEALSKFKEGKLQVLVATDVAARGLDIDDLPLVVNYELPHTPEDYVHRIGRTGRAGALGEAISLVAHEEEKYLVDIEKMLKKKVAYEVVEGFDPVAAAAQSPLRERGERPLRGERRPAARSDVAAAPAPAAVPDGGAETRVRERGQSHREDVHRASRDGARPEGRSERERQRDEAYAKNPDQPVVSRTEDAQGDAKSALMHGSGAHRHGAGKSRPIPALLMKRRAPEPENA
jgi:ATP-dependent RNA helicase RhlE